MSRLIYRKRTLTLTFEVSETAPADVTDQELSQEVDTLIHDWNSGGYLFSVEMALHGLADVVKAAIYRAMYERMDVKYNGEYLKTDNGHIFKTIVMTDLVTRGLHVEVTSTQIKPDVLTTYVAPEPYWSDKWDHLKDS